MSTDSMHDVARDTQPFHLGDRIRKAWELAGYADTRSFAQAAGLDRGAVRRYEQTGVVPRRSTLITIAWHTPVTLEWLETGTGPVFKATGPGMVHPLGLEPRTHWNWDDDGELAPVTPIDWARSIRELVSLEAVPA